MAEQRVLSACAVLAISAGLAPGDVVYDALGDWTIDPGVYTWADFSTIGGGIALGGELADMQLADDFTLGTAHDVTRVTADFGGLVLGSLPPAGSSVMVEFFTDAGGTPSETAAASVTTTGWDLVSTIPNNTGIWGTGANEPGARVSVDLSASGVTLGAGTWWMSVVVIDESPTSDAYMWLGRRDLPSLGNTLHTRDGGQDHGNGYTGLVGSNDWITHTDGSDANLAMRIEGVPVPAPGAAGVLVLSGLLLGRRRRS